jgi:hypothetical protein
MRVRAVFELSAMDQACRLALVADVGVVPGDAKLADVTVGVGLVGEGEGVGNEKLELKDQPARFRAVGVRVGGSPSSPRPTPRVEVGEAQKSGSWHEVRISSAVSSAVVAAGFAERIVRSDHKSIISQAASVERSCDGADGKILLSVSM